MQGKMEAQAMRMTANFAGRKIGNGTFGK